MILNGNGNPGTVIRGPSSTDADFSLYAVARTVEISPGISPTPVTVGDAEFIDSDAATVDHEFDIVVQETIPETLPVEFESTNESIATVSSTGRISRVADGTVGILVSSRLVTKREDVTVEREDPATLREFQNFVAGSAAEDTTDAIDGRIVGLNSETTKLIHDGTSYRGLCWAYDLRQKLTCLSREIPRATLVSPRHIVMAEHYQASGNRTFLAIDGTIITRTVSSRLSIGPANSADGYATDITVGILDSDVPESISFASILPANWQDYFEFATGAPRIPALCIDQEEKALVGDYNELSTTRTSMTNPTDAQRLTFYEHKIGGDSGNPAFLILGGELVLMTTWTFGGAGSGPQYHELLTEINAAMTTLGGGYQLTTIDLTGYPTY